MNLIAAVDRQWGIGHHGKLLVSIPKDKQLFREETMGRVIIMGRKTLESLPGGQPLYGRTNIVLSRNRNYRVKGAVVVHSLEECLHWLREHQIGDEDIFVIGGESIYSEFLPYVQVAHITAIDFTYLADARMENLDALPDWKIMAESDEETYFNLTYTFKLYVRSKYVKFQ